MKISLRASAVSDIKAASIYYHRRAGPETALDFVEALEEAINHLRQFLLIGSSRFASELDMPDLQSWPLQKFPYIIFYVASAERIDIRRVLHARRDVPAHLTGSGT